jgi:hypothetical protein
MYPLPIFLSFFQLCYTLTMILSLRTIIIILSNNV